MEWSALDTGCASVECASVIQDTEENIVAALSKTVDNQTTEEAWNVNRLILNNFYEHKKSFFIDPRFYIWNSFMQMFSRLGQTRSKMFLQQEVRNNNNNKKKIPKKCNIFF